jgi:hypothetical protein
MQHLIVRIAAIAASMVAPAIEAAALNKCIDAQGQVTYSNLPCRNAREVRKVEIDPPPKPDLAPAPAPVPAKAAAPQPLALPRSAASPQIEAKPQAAPLPAAVPPAIGAPPASSQGLPTAAPQKPAKSSIRLTARQCDSLTDQLGKVLDQMDQTRRSGYTQQQMDAWEQEIQDIESKKQQSGCF